MVCPLYNSSLQNPLQGFFGIQEPNKVAVDKENQRLGVKTGYSKVAYKILFTDEKIVRTIKHFASLVL